MSNTSTKTRTRYTDRIVRPDGPEEFDACCAAAVAVGGAVAAEDGGLRIRIPEGKMKAFNRRLESRGLPRPRNVRAPAIGGGRHSGAIRRARKTLGLTREQVARRARVSEGTVSLAEHGGRVNAADLAAVALAVGLLVNARTGPMGRADS